MASLYNAALLEHNAHPDYKYTLSDANHIMPGKNPSCGDEMTLYLHTENKVIEEASFTGHGCAVSQASADIMAEMITGKTIDEAKTLVDLFLKMIKGDTLSQQEFDLLDEAGELQNISRMPSRVKCAELAWRTLDEAI